MDPIKKSEELRKGMSSLSEGIFTGLKNKILGRSDKDDSDQEGAAKDQNGIVKLNGNMWSINGNEISKIDVKGGGDDTYDLMMNYDWENGKLSWLTRATFRAHVINIDFDNETVIVFIGVWLDGDFLGNKFSEVIVGPGKAIFAGGTFGSTEGGGLLIITNEFWKAKPTDFIEGTIYKTTDGILGLPNAGNNDSEFHLIQAQKGHTIQITTDDDKVHKIHVNKRIDRVNSDFSYDLLNSGERKVIKWSDVRNSYDSFYIRVGSTLNLPNILETGSKIKSIEILGGDASAASSTSDVKAYSFPFRSLPPSLKKGVDLPDNIKLKMSISLRNADDIKFFKRATSDFSQKGIEFENNLNNIKKGIEIGLIDGYSQYPHLSMLWGRTRKGKEFNIEQNPTYDKSMKYMDLFVKHFIMNLHKDAQDRILSTMREGLMIMIPDEATPSPTTKRLGVKKTTSTTAGETVGIKKPKKKLTNEDIVRSRIRDVLRNESDETFFGKNTL